MTRSNCSRLLQQIRGESELVRSRYFSSHVYATCDLLHLQAACLIGIHWRAENDDDMEPLVALRLLRVAAWHGPAKL